MTFGVYYYDLHDPIFHARSGGRQYRQPFESQKFLLYLELMMIHFWIPFLTRSYFSLSQRSENQMRLPFLIGQHRSRQHRILKRMKIQNIFDNAFYGFHIFILYGLHQPMSGHFNGRLFFHFEHKREWPFIKFQMHSQLMSYSMKL